MIKAFIASLVLVFSAMALPDENPRAGSTVMKEAEYMPLLTQAVKYSRYSMPWLQRPIIHVMTEQGFTAYACGGGDPKECPYLAITERTGAFEIFIRPMAKDQYSQSRNRALVHELVHWLQEAHGWNPKAPTCADDEAHEAEAYAVAYLYAVLEEKVDQPFWARSQYNNCLVLKMFGRGGRGHH